MSILKKKKTGKKLILASDWQHLTKADIDLIVKQINNPPQPSEAMKKAEELHRTILQLD